MYLVHVHPVYILAILIIQAVVMSHNYILFLAEFYCYCDAGWEQNHDTGACTTRACDATQCMHNQQCSADSLECVCEPGLTGDNCELSKCAVKSIHFADCL